MVFCWCPPGSYTAGSPPATPGRYADEAERQVSISQGFWISKYELTQAQWLGNRPGGAVAQHKLHPQDSANQSKDGGRMLTTLNTAEWNAGRLPKDWEYALPSEDQWEYAARAGTTTTHYFGADPALLPRHANFGDKRYYDTQDVFSNAGHRTLDDGTPRLAQVGLYQPNPWGLHDVYGNLAEWCSNSAARGGSWVSTADTCRSAYRQKPGDRDSDIYIGFRLILQSKSTPQP
jgi:formylglycine-generating enzyme required for sulfatase activity